MKVQNFRLSTAQVKFHQICTLIGSFCWKYKKIQLKKYRGVMSHNTNEWCKIWKITDLVFQKWQEFGEFWSKHSKVSKIRTLIGTFCAKCITFDQKSTEELPFMTLKSHSKFQEKLSCGLENYMINLANFYQNTWKRHNWYFHGIILSK